MNFFTQHDCCCYATLREERVGWGGRIETNPKDTVSVQLTVSAQLTVDAATNTRLCMAMQSGAMILISSCVGEPRYVRTTQKWHADKRLWVRLLPSEYNISVNRRDSEIFHPLFLRRGSRTDLTYHAVGE